MTISGHVMRTNARFYARHSGITLIELVVTLSIAAILLAVAVPSFSSLIASQRTRATASDLYAAISQTRSEAITRNTNVSLTAVDGSWSKGWNIVDSRQPLTPVQVREAFTGVTFTGSTSVVYQSSGRLQGVTVPMIVVRAPGHDSATQCVSIDSSGRPYMKASTSC